ncbi:hypothetical protein Dsin_022969 [Dipteronia sinensis]|uniref:Uncharacterized protein n=1 Tax=Dipteronia sinensis TaxID=43782 RepID=A0AAE0E0K8_9ROSI|nr:hypothetical protein Dsin_022969 [Dipteronia sinensis]
MSSQVSEFSASIQTDTSDVKRHTTSYHPTLWGDQILTHASDSATNDATTEQEFQGLRQEVRSMLTSTKDNQKLCLINAVQRLGVAYHFEREIEDALENLYNNYSDDDNNLYTVSLRFRLLRQQGYYVPSDVFNKFKDDQAVKFKESLINDVAGMLCLYEAAHLGILGEDVLDEALAFTTSHLESMASDRNQVSPQLAEQITHALNRPIRRNLPRLEARYYIDIYSGDDSKNQTLLNFAKLDFNMLQVQHQKELSSITEWWKNLDVETNLPYARNRVVEVYFWIMGVLFEGKYSFARRLLTKATAMASIIDDTYDAYGTYEELKLFTDAIRRWDINTIDVLPDYMKLIYRSVLDVYSEGEEELSKDGRSYCMRYAIEETKNVIGAYFTEAKWCNEGYVPKIEEYLDTALVTSNYRLMAILAFLGMGNIANQEVFQWSSNQPNKMIKASETISRLMDDLVSHEYEKKRQHVASGVECYMKQYEGVSKEEVIKLFRKEISNAWKDINEEFVKPTAAIPITILMRILNLARVMDVIYKDDDGYTNPHVIKHYIDSVLVNPVPV